MQIEINPKGYFDSITEFKFVKDIGVGSFGKVKLAIHRGTRKQYAVKIIDLQANLSTTQLHVIARQIKVHSKLDHPHIIKLWDTLLENNKIYMIMDYAKNGSLFKYHSILLQEGSQPNTSQIYQFFYQTLQALKYLHSNDIMHRDIKPENLLLDQDLNVKLCDFGWATNQITMSRTTFCGTYEYMAPQMALQKSYDYRIDIWALGVLLYELVHGRAPFQAQNIKIMKQRINKGSYQINSHCSGTLKDLIVDILQFTPQKRLSTREIEIHPWVQTCQNVSFNGGSGLADEIINASQGQSMYQKKNGVVAVPTKVKKHQYQRSMGNFVFEINNKNQYEDLFGLEQQNSKIKQNYIDIQQAPNPIHMSKQQQIKKHKRNITQPNNDFIVPQRIQEVHPKSVINKKTQIMFGSLQTQTDTPTYQITQFQAAKILSNLSRSKKKQKCKTQGQDDIIRYEAQLTLGSKKNFPDIQQSAQVKKKKSPVYTETGPIITSSSALGHTRNYSNSQLKQNDKMKKKHKLQEKANPKVKKIEQKMNQIPGKFSYDKTKERQKVNAA